MRTLRLANNLVQAWDVLTASGTSNERVTGKRNPISCTHAR